MKLEDAFHITAPPSVRPLGHDPYALLKPAHEPQGVRAASCSAFEFEPEPEEIGDNDDITKAVKAGYALALHDADAAAFGLRLFLRGRANIYAARTDLRRLRAALDAMEAALED